MKKLLVLSGVVWVACFSVPALADFVDALPELPVTPTPAPAPTISSTPAAKGTSHQGEKQNSSSKGASKKKKRGQNGTSGPGPGNPSTSTAPNEDSGESPDEKGSQSQGQAASAPQSGKGGGGLFGTDVTKHNSEAPISTKGDTLEGSLAKGKMTLTGNVEIQQADTVMHSDNCRGVFKTWHNNSRKSCGKRKSQYQKVAFAHSS